MCQGNTFQRDQSTQGLCLDTLVDCLTSRPAPQTILKTMFINVTLLILTACSQHNLFMWWCYLTPELSQFSLLNRGCGCGFSNWEQLRILFHHLNMAQSLVCLRFSFPPWRIEFNSPSHVFREFFAVTLKFIYLENSLLLLSNSICFRV